MSPPESMNPASRPRPAAWPAVRAGLAAAWRAPDSPPRQRWVGRFCRIFLPVFPGLQRRKYLIKSPLSQRRGWGASWGRAPPPTGRPLAAERRPLRAKHPGSEDGNTESPIRLFIRGMRGEVNIKIRTFVKIFSLPTPGAGNEGTAPTPGPARERRVWAGAALSRLRYKIQSPAGLATVLGRGLQKGRP